MGFSALCDSLKNFCRRIFGFSSVENSLRNTKILSLAFCSSWIPNQLLTEPIHLTGKILRNPNQKYGRICSSWNPNQLLTEPVHLKRKILSLQVTCKKNRCLARLCFDILQVVHQLARILQGFYCLVRNLQEIYSSQKTCTILARVVFFFQLGVVRLSTKQFVRKNFIVGFI